jgi:TorA maturation chaperone TorD
MDGPHDRREAISEMNRIIPTEESQLSHGVENNREDIFTGEILVCGLIARALYIYPDKAWFQSLIDEDVFAETPFGAGQVDVDAGMAQLREWGVTNQGILSQEAFDNIESDYMHLFVGPSKVLAPPWESFYLSKDHILFQKQTLQVRNWYRRYGLQVENLYNEPDDHLGIEFSFLGHMASLTLEASKAGDQDSFDNHWKAQSVFVRTHLSRWVYLWYANVEKYASTAFYAGLGRLACGVIAELNSIFNQPLLLK